MTLLPTAAAAAAVIWTQQQASEDWPSEPMPFSHQ